MPAGRPTKYDPKYCEEMIEFMSEGASIVEFAVSIGVMKSTIYEWANKHQEFSDAKKKAVEASESWWTRTGRQGLYHQQGPGSSNLNPTLWYMNMKNRFGWRDKQEVTHEVSTIEIREKDKDL